jgi:pimeloyl-ACP methyl ester carboxylesterase
MNHLESDLPYPLTHQKINGVSWEYITTAKQDKAFVLLPGGGQTAESNYHLIRAFEREYQVITLTIHDVNSINEFNFALNQILDKENVNKIILYGLSMGGNLAQTYARDNPEKILGLILSHTCTPKSESYKNKVLKPLNMVNIILPVIPNSFIKFATHFSGNIQGLDQKSIRRYFVPVSEEDKRFNKAIRNDYYANFLDKTLVKTTINIHRDFAKQILKPEDYTYLDDRILILRTDNDPLMQDEGDFQYVYPNAKVKEFKDTGHLTFQLREKEIIEVINQYREAKKL